jgi:flagellar basal-body rod protein FlgG
MANISGIFNYLTAMSSNQGYQVLSANLPQSINNFVKESGVNNDIATFEKGVASTKTVTDFVNNPNLVNFVLTAFGLDSVENEQGLIKQVLTQDPNNPSSLVNQLSDPRFKQLATALDFYDNGLSGLKAVGLGTPTAATSAEGVSLATGTTASTASASSSSSALTLGLTISGKGYLQLQKTDGSTVYAQSAYFTVNSDNELALPDGTTLVPALTIPTGATALTSDTQGDIYAQVAGKPTLVGQILLTNFSNPSALQTDSKTGYITATTAAGTPTVGVATDTTTGLGSVQSYVGNTAQTIVNNYVTNLFEESVGDSNTAIREAFDFQRNIASETDNTGTDAKLNNAYAVLGDSVIRDVVLTTIGQPSSIAEQSLSTQTNIVEAGLNGENFQNKSQVNNFVQRYLTTVDASGQSTAPSSTSTSAAVQLLTAYASSSSSSSSSTSSVGESILKIIA